MFSIDTIHLQMLEYLMLGTLSRILTPSCSTDYQSNESTEVQTLGVIRVQLYHQCFEQVWQHNFTSIIGLRRSTQRHRSSKVGTSIVDLRKSTHRSSKVDTSIIDLRRSTHRSSKIEGGNIAPTTQHRADILTIRHRILPTTALQGVVSGWCCKEDIDILIIIITFPYSTCITSFFWQQHSFFVH